MVLTAVLQVGMVPLMARDFHRVSLLGPVANLVAVPLVGIIVPLGFLCLTSAMVLPVLGRWLAYAVAGLIQLQGAVVAWFANIPHSSYRIPGPPHWLMVIFFLALAAAAILLRARSIRWRWQLRVVTALLAGLTVVIATYPFHPQVTRDALEKTVLDVGQGDSILIVSPKGSTLLIDGGGAFYGFRGYEEHMGPDPGEDAVSTYLWSRGIQRLDAVALTHAHQDHIGGLSAVLQNFRVFQLILGRNTAAPAMNRLKELAASRLG